MHLAGLTHSTVSTDSQSMRGGVRSCTQGGLFRFMYCSYQCQQLPVPIALLHRNNEEMPHAAPPSAKEAMLCAPQPHAWVIFTPERSTAALLSFICG